MKTGIKALPLSLALSFLALLGACSSVNSTPNSELPSGDNSVILEGAENGTEAVEDLTGEGTSDDTELDSAEMETTDGIEDETAVDGEAFDDESAEMETTDGIEDETAVDGEAFDTESADIENTDEVDPTEIILPESDSAEVETDDEAAENVIPEVDTDIQPE